MTSQERLRKLHQCVLVISQQNTRTEVSLDMDRETLSDADYAEAYDILINEARGVLEQLDVPTEKKE